MRLLASILFIFLISQLTLAQAASDTINRTDINGLRQGYWKIYNNTKQFPGYKVDQLVTEGFYVDNKKQGTWKRYYPNNQLKDIIRYENNRPKGDYTTYYENGQVEEKGTWVGNKNTGDFKRFYEDGTKHQDFEFNAAGKRQGEQVYYWPNGQVMIQGSWNEGKESGYVREYYENGDIRAERYFDGGTINVSKSKEYKSTVPVKNQLEEELKAAPDVKVLVDEGDYLNQGSKEKWSGDGYHKLYNKNHQISKDGIFKKYRLMDGKWYRYDDDGILETVEIYKKGRYVGDGVAEE